MAINGVGGGTVAPVTNVAAPQTAAAPAPAANATTETIDQNMADQQAQAEAMMGQMMGNFAMNQFFQMQGEQQKMASKDEAKRKEHMQEMKK